MLQNNRVCKINSQYFKQMAIQHCKNNMYSGDLLMSLREMLSQNSKMCYAFASEAFKVFSNGKRCDEDDFEDCYELFAMYGIVLSGVVWGYDTSSGKMSLYTSSIGVLEGLAQRGVLKGKKQPITIELEDIKKKLYESDRIKKSIKDGKQLVVVRLDAELVGNSMKMTATMPRSMPRLDNTVFLAFDTILCASQMLYAELQVKVLRISMGNKVRDVTLNRDILTSIYGLERTSVLCSYLPDAYMLRFYVPSVGASIYTPGVTNINLAEIDKVQEIGLADIDLSEIKLDYSGVYDHFLSRVDKVPDNKIGLIAQDFGLECVNADPEFIRSELKRKIPDEFYAQEVWEEMKEYPKLFVTASYIKKAPRYGKNYQKVSNPKSVEELEKLLRTNVCKIQITKRKGSFSTIIGTNSTELLSKFYGDDYVARFESDGTRGRKFINLRKKGVPIEEATRLTGITSNTEANSMIESAEANKTVVKQSHLVTVRSLECRGNGRDFYKNVDIESIVEIAILS